MTRTLIALALFVAAACQANAAGWEPPADMTMQEVLNGAHKDAQAKRYPQALEKFVWFHEHALEREPAMAGVRLSFALSGWNQLAKKYPPAMAKLKAARDQAGETALKAENPFAAFHDFVAINRELKEDTLTVDLFEKISKSSSDRAEGIYMVAEPAIIQSKRYDLCNTYVKVEAMDRLLENRSLRKSFPLPPGAEVVMDKLFTTQAANLVALLVVNNRKKEAEEAARRAMDAWDDATFKKSIQNALMGTFPPAFP